MWIGLNGLNGLNGFSGLNGLNGFSGLNGLNGFSGLNCGSAFYQFEASSLRWREFRPEARDKPARNLRILRLHQRLERCEQFDTTNSNLQRLNAPPNRFIDRNLRQHRKLRLTSLRFRYMLEKLAQVHISILLRALHNAHIRFDLLGFAEFHAQLRSNERSIHHFVVFLQLHRQISTLNRSLRGYLSIK